MTFDTKTFLKNFIDGVKTYVFISLCISFVLGGFITTKLFDFVKKNYDCPPCYSSCSCEAVFLAEEDLSDEYIISTQQKMNRINSIIPNKKDIDFSKFSEKEKHTYLLTELDVLYGQLNLVNIILKGKNIKVLNDSLTKKFDTKMLEREKY
jgi:hypothetical protein